MPRNWKNHIGVCGYHASVDRFLEMDERDWLRGLCDFKNDMFPEEEYLRPDDQNETVDSYRLTFRILQEQLSKLVKVRPTIRNLEIAFEYVIPTSDPYESFVRARRADVVLFGRERTVVLEFKTGLSRDELEWLKAEAIRQTNDYLKGLHDWHLRLEKNGLRGAAVLYALDDFLESALYPPRWLVEPVKVLSEDRIPGFLSDCFSEHDRPVEDPSRWLVSFGTPEPEAVRLAREISAYCTKHLRDIPSLDNEAKAEARRSVKRKLGLTSTAPLKPLVEHLTDGRWELRDAVVQVLDNLPQDRLEVLFKGWQNLSDELQTDGR